jgi:hypothetical protein
VASHYNGPGNGDDVPDQVAVSPDGGTVFVTGGSNGGGSGKDYAMVGYDPATGAQLWASRYNAPANRRDLACSVAAGPGGRSVFLTWTSTGARLWTSRYHGPGQCRQHGVGDQRADERSRGHNPLGQLQVRVRGRD